jgi:hypothetical protein
VNVSSKVRTGTIGVAVLAALAVAAPSTAGALPRVVSYPNCTAMHVHYRGGVSRPGAHDHRRHGGHAEFKPFVDRALYEANKRLDRDHDGIACEH